MLSPPRTRTDRKMGSRRTKARGDMEVCSLEPRSPFGMRERVEGQLSVGLAGERRASLLRVILR